MYICKNCGSKKMYLNSSKELVSGEISHYCKCGDCNNTTTYRNNLDASDFRLELSVSRKGGLTLFETPVSSSAFVDDSKDVDISNTYKRYIITSCQSNTRTNYGFLAALESFISAHETKLFVIPIKYRNPRVSETEEVYTYDEYLEPYLLNENVKIHPKLRILGELKINATAENPLSGLDSLSKECSIIIGHNQLQMKSLPVAHSEDPRIMTTTGTVSVENYSSSKAGFKAEFNHSASAILVEIDGDDFHIRQLEYDGVGFYDLDKYYTNSGMTSGNRIAALIPGDEHVRHNATDVQEATYSGDGSMLKVLKPEIIVRHDFVDCFSISHHHEGDDIKKYAKFKAGDDDLEAELDEAVEFLFDTSYTWADKYNLPLSMIISSNHNDHLYRWLNRCNPSVDLKNCLIYHKLKYLLLKEAKIVGSEMLSPNPLQVYVDDAVVEKGYDNLISYEFLDRKNSCKIKGIEVSFHGDAGPNGSRGSRVSFSKLSSKTVIGHSHTPGIEKGCYQVGTSSWKELDYNIGPSSWMNTHCVIYPNGKRCLINIIHGKWRLSEN